MTSIASSHENWKGGRRKQFKLSSGGCCFICLGEAGHNKSKNKDGRSCASITVLLRYLEISLKTSFTSVLAETLTLPLEKELCSIEKSDFVVEVCERCEKKLENVAELLKMMEQLEMKVNYCLENILDWIMERDGNSGSARMEEYQRRMEADNHNFGFIKPTKNLRGKLANKCSQLVSTAQPRLFLQKIKEIEPGVYENTGDIEENQKRSPQPTSYDVNPAISIKIENEDDHFSDIDLHHTPMAEDEKENPLAEETPDVNVSSQAELPVELQEGASPLPSIPQLKEKKYKCDICHKTFKGSGSLSRHHDLHRRMKFPCIGRIAGCSRKFAYKIDLQVHEKECEWAKSRASARSARKTKSSNRKFSCPLCQKKFSSRSGLSVHHSFAHKTIREHICNLCNKAFKVKQQLTTHFNSIHLLIKYLCGYPGCVKSFTAKTNMLAHVRRQHPNWDQSNFLDTDSANNPTSDELTKEAPDLDLNLNHPPSADEKLKEDHLTEQTPDANVSSPTELPVKLLQDTCATSSIPQFLTNATSGGESPGDAGNEATSVASAGAGLAKVCTNCNRAFPSTSTDYFTHMANCKKQTETKNFSCTFCHRSFSSRNGLTCHYSSVHKKSPCSHCNKVFKSSFHLTFHVNSVHLGIKHPCRFPGCGKSFTSKSYTLTHARRKHPSWDPPNFLENADSMTSTELVKEASVFLPMEYGNVKIKVEEP